MVQKGNSNCSLIVNRWCLGWYNLGADLGGGCRGCAPLPEMTYGFLIQLVFCKKNVVYWCLLRHFLVVHPLLKISWIRPCTLSRCCCWLVRRGMESTTPLFAAVVTANQTTRSRCLRCWLRCPGDRPLHHYCWCTPRSTYVQDWTQVLFN